MEGLQADVREICGRLSKPWYGEWHQSQPKGGIWTLGGPEPRTWVPRRVVSLGRGLLGLGPSVLQCAKHLHSGFYSTRTAWSLNAHTWAPRRGLSAGAAQCGQHVLCCLQVGHQRIALPSLSPSSRPRTKINHREGKGNDRSAVPKAETSRLEQGFGVKYSGFISLSDVCYSFFPYTLITKHDCIWAAVYPAKSCISNPPLQ